MTDTVRTLTDAEVGAWVADVNAKMAALQRRWDESGHTDLFALMGALVFCQATKLPAWVFEGLMQNLKQQVPQLKPPYHQIRWLAVREGYDQKLGSDYAYEYAKKKLRSTRARGSSPTMMKSYQKIERALPGAAKHSQRRGTYRPRQK